jgi:hypothetical protein
MRTPPARAAAVRDLFAVAPGAARRYFAVQPDGSFSVDVAWMQSRVEALST